MNWNADMQSDDEGLECVWCDVTGAETREAKNIVGNKHMMLVGLLLELAYKRGATRQEVNDAFDECEMHHPCPAGTNWRPR